MPKTFTTTETVGQVTVSMAWTPPPNAYALVTYDEHTLNVTLHPSLEAALDAGHAFQEPADDLRWFIITPG